MQPFGFMWETLPPYPSRQQGASKSSLLIIDRVCWSSSVKWIWILMGAPPFFFNLVFEWIAVSPWAEFPHLKEKVNDTNFLRVNETNKWVWEPGLFCLLPPLCTPTPHQCPRGWTGQHFLPSAIPWSLASGRQWQKIEGHMGKERLPYPLLMLVLGSGQWPHCSLHTLAPAPLGGG